MQKIFKNDPGNFDGKITIPLNICKILPDETMWHSSGLDFPARQN
jgi:hypothetical protein